MREWRCGFDAGCKTSETAMSESGVSGRLGCAGNRRNSVTEHLCIRMYWNLGDQSHEHLFTDSH